MTNTNYTDLSLLMLKHYLTGKKVKCGDWKVGKIGDSTKVYYQDKLVANIYGVSIYLEGDFEKLAINTDELMQAIWNGTPVTKCGGVHYSVCYNPAMHMFGVTTGDSGIVLDPTKPISSTNLVELQKTADKYTSFVDASLNFDITPVGNSYMIIRS